MQMLRIRLNDFDYLNATATVAAGAGVETGAAGAGAAATAIKVIINKKIVEKRNGQKIQINKAFIIYTYICIYINISMYIHTIHIYFRRCCMQQLPPAPHAHRDDDDDDGDGNRDDDDDDDDYDYYYYFGSGLSVFVFGFVFGFSVCCICNGNAPPPADASEMHFKCDFFPRIRNAKCENAATLTPLQCGPSPPLAATAAAHSSPHRPSGLPAAAAHLKVVDNLASTMKINK